MTKSSTVQKKLKSYSALAGTIAAAAGSANAQTVVYTDVTPDSVVSNLGVYNLDLNNDAVVDFELIQRSGYYGGFASYDAVGVFPRAGNAIDTSGGDGTPSALGSGIVLDVTDNWIDSAQMAAISPPTANGLALVLPGFGVYGGQFLGQTGKFLPLRFNVGGNQLYGWVRLSVDNDATSFTVIDYAYTNVPNSYSITGATVGIAEAAKLDHINIYSYDKNINVSIAPYVAPEGIITVTNLLGQAITEVAINNSETIIPMENAKPGIYLVTVKQENGSYTKRISIR